MIHLFIDTNIFLNFYSFEGERLDQLTRLIEAIDAGNVCLHVPQQVLNEFSPNREQKIKAANNEFAQAQVQTAVPRHMQAYPQATEYNKVVDELKDLRKKLVNLAVADASNHSLAPDIKLKELFEKATKYPDDDEIFDIALRRMQRGNPPGKSGSTGDQYNWEMLLHMVPDGADLYVVSKDGDYGSLLNKSIPHPFLKAEWAERKGSEIHIYPEIKPFVDRANQMLVQAAALLALQNIPQPQEDNDKDPLAPGGAQEPAPLDANAGAPPAGPLPQGAGAADIDPEVEKRKLDAIESLVDSYSFAATHGAITCLNKYQQLFTKADAERLVRAAVDNQQVRWIATDSDVYAFFATLLTQHSDIDKALFERAVKVFGLEPEPEPESSDAPEE